MRVAPVVLNVGMRSFLDRVYRLVAMILGNGNGGSSVAEDTEERGKREKTRTPGTGAEARVKQDAGYRQRQRRWIETACPSIAASTHKASLAKFARMQVDND